MNNEKYLNQTGLAYYHGRISNQFASQTDLETLEDRVDDIVTQGGEPNVINTVKVNNTALVPDANKAVNIDLSAYAETSDLPSSTSDLTNDGDGESPFATEDYVESNGGKIQKVKVNNVEQTIDTSDKSVNITVPTASTDLSDGSTIAHTSDIPTALSDLTNDEGFIDNTVNNLTNYYTKNETYTQSEVDNLINTAISGGFVPVATLPTASASTMNKIYLVPKSASKTNNTKDEYITVEIDESGTTAYEWELIGDTQLDLSGYWNNTNLVAITTAEIDALFE